MQVGECGCATGAVHDWQVLLRGSRSNQGSLWFSELCAATN